MFYFSKKFYRIFTATLAILLGTGLLSGPLWVSGEDFTSTNFTVQNPVITIEGGRSTSLSFEYLSSTGQTVIGESTSENFTVRSGFLYFSDETLPPSPPVVASLGGAPPEPVPVLPAAVTFSGKAYPQSEVILLKDGRLAATITASSDGGFPISLSGLSPGDYLFVLYARDSEGRRSSFLTIPLKLESGTAITVRNILMPPTIGVDKTRVKKGETLLVTGESAPAAKISMEIPKKDGDLSFNTNADGRGRWDYSLDTSSFDFGTYEIFVRASLEGISSAVQTLVRFIVDVITEEAVLPFGGPPPGVPPAGDLNRDGRVNLIDFSILVWWIERPDPPVEVDLNGDNTVDLIDFSIAAYYWTG